MGEVDPNKDLLAAMIEAANKIYQDCLKKSENLYLMPWCYKDEIFEKLGEPDKILEDGQCVWYNRTLSEKVPPGTIVAVPMPRLDSRETFGIITA